MQSVGGRNFLGLASLAGPALETWRREGGVPASAIQTLNRDAAFKLLAEARESREIVPLFGSGVSVDAGIPTSVLLADYIVGVSAYVGAQGWDHYAEFLRTRGWPSRHDVWADWIGDRPGRDYASLDREFATLRDAFYRYSAVHEMRPHAPMSARLLQSAKSLDFGTTGFTDYRSLLSSITGGDDKLSDSFFDHLVRGRQPSTTHQFIAFFAQLFGVRLILTTNFDDLIERALRDEGLNPTVYEVARDGTVPSKLLIRSQRLAVVKLHGGTHSLRTGFDLDHHLPAAALEEIRGYLDPARGGHARPSRAPLLLVMGYSGSDQRVMDAVADHIKRWRPSNAKHGLGDRQEALVLWVSREGAAPPLLEDAARVALYPATSASPPTLSGPVALCAYRSARLFMQEAYQHATDQHAVSRSHYRALASVPKVPPLALPTGPNDNNRPPTRFLVYWADRTCSGTSARLSYEAYRQLGRTHEVIWIDAAEFWTRARLVSELMEEFSTHDRGLTTIGRPQLLSDVDYLSCVRAAKASAGARRARAVAPGSEADVSPEKPTGGQPPPESPTRVEEDIVAAMHEDNWEAEVARRWIVRALRRGNYVVAIDSLGEFGRRHPIIDVMHGEELDHSPDQRKLLREFLSALGRQSSDFGRSVIAGAYTPMADAAMDHPVKGMERQVQAGQAAIQVGAIVSGDYIQHATQIGSHAGSPAREVKATRQGKTLALLNSLVNGDQETISSRQAVHSPEPQQGAGQLHDGQVVLGLLLVPHQDPPAPVQPRDGPLDDVSPGLVPLPSLPVLLLLADPPDVRLVPEHHGRRLAGRAVERLVEAQVLLVPQRGPAARRSPPPARPAAAASRAGSPARSRSRSGRPRPRSKRPVSCRSSPGPSG